MAYMREMKMVVAIIAYSMSWVALKAINMREMKRKTLLLKRVLRFFGIVIALPAKRPWYKMMRVKRMGWALITASVGVLTGPRKLLSFGIYSNLRY